MSTWLTRTLLSVLLIPIVGYSLFGQQTKSFEILALTKIELSHVKVEDGFSSTPISLTPTLQIKASNWEITGSGQISYFRSNTISGYGEVTGRRLLYKSEKTSAILDMESGTGTYQGQTTGQYLTSGMYVNRGKYWGRVHTGYAKDTSKYSFIGTQIGRNQRHNTLNTTVTASLLHFRKALIYNLAFGGYYESKYFHLLAYIGTSNGSSHPSFTSTSTWGVLNTQIPLRNQLALTISAGKTSTNIERGIPTVNFISAGIQLGRRTSNSSNLSLSKEASQTILEWTSTGRVLSIQIKNAKSVEIRGSFTDWYAIPMREKTTGLWVLPVSLSPGVYPIAIRIDNTTWRPPPGVPVTKDEFGGINGLLIIP